MSYVFVASCKRALNEGSNINQKLSFCDKFDIQVKIINGNILTLFQSHYQTNYQPKIKHTGGGQKKVAIIENMVNVI